MHYIKRWFVVFGLLWGSLLYAKMVQTMLHGKKIDVYIPQNARIDNGSQLSLKVMVSDPNPPAPTNLRRNNMRANALTILSQRKATQTDVTISYISSGGKDIYGEACYDFPANAKAVFEAAAQAWEGYLNSSVPIRIEACWASFGGYTLGYSTSYAVSDFQNAPMTGTYFEISLANSLAGYDLDASNADIFITINADFDWYYGLDGNPGSSQSDLFTVLMHEIGHGLGFGGGLFYDANNDYGYIGTKNNVPYIWDRKIYYGSTPILNLGNYTYDLGVALRSDNLYFVGTYSKAANNNNPVKIYAPSTWLYGSSYSHLDYNTFSGTPHRMMVYALSPGDAIHEPGDITLGILKDIGWDVEITPPDDTSYYVIPVSGGGSVVIAL